MIRTRAGWARSANSTSVLCRPPLLFLLFVKIYIQTLNVKNPLAVLPGGGGADGLIADLSKARLETKKLSFFFR